MKKVASIIIMLMLVSLASASASMYEEDDKLQGPIKLDGTELLWDYQLKIAKEHAGLTGQELANELSTHHVLGDAVNDTASFWTLKGAYLEEWIQVDATCRAVGTYCYVYVEDAEWTNGNITQNDVDTIRDTFDNTIYPSEASNFGTPPVYNGDSKITIFLTDLKDGYDGSNGWYAGYFYSLNYTTDTNSNNRHMITIDTYPTIVNNPYYEEKTLADGLGTVAHEYQHLLHYWSDPAETTWINEGQSDYAEFLTLGMLPQSHVADFLAYHSVNLEQWGSFDVSIVENYGAALLYMLYLYENFGGASIMSNIHQDSTYQGRSSINQQLATYDTNFIDVFTDWTLANLLDDPNLVGDNSGAALGYINLDIPSLNTGYLDVMSHDWDYGPFPSYDTAYGMSDGYPTPDNGYWHDTQQQLDANYFIYERGMNPSSLTFEFYGNAFDGNTGQVVIPSRGDLEWYSGSGNYFFDGDEHTLTKTIDLSSATTPEMNINTWYDIEPGWDFGYVEVSTDGGSTWTTLQDQDGIMNTYVDPDNTDQVGYPCAYAFTGYSSGWIYDVTYDLSAYAGSSIMVRFSYFTDMAGAGYGWIVDNIRITDNGTVLCDGSDASDDLWNANGWSHTDTTYELNWSVYLIGYPIAGMPSQNDIYKMNLETVSQDGKITIPGLGSLYDHFVVVPSMTSSEGTLGHFDYLHRGYTTTTPGANISAHPLYTTALKKVNPVLDSALAAIAAAEEEGKDTSGINALMDQVNEHIANSSTGANYVYKANQLRLAMQTLEEVMSQLGEL